MFQRFESLPKEVHAVQFKEENKNLVLNSLTGQYAAGFEGDSPIIKVTTIHGEVAIVRIGDWIVEESEIGKYYPVKDSVFRERYSQRIATGLE